jgi:hypothetical protein
VLRHRVHRLVTKRDGLGQEVNGERLGPHAVVCPARGFPINKSPAAPPRACGGTAPSVFFPLAGCWLSRCLGDTLT